MGGGPSTPPAGSPVLVDVHDYSAVPSPSSCSGPGLLVAVGGTDEVEDIDSSVGLDGVEAADGVTAPGYRLRWSKSKVYVHPTAFVRDNIPGFLGILQKEHAVSIAWIPQELVESMADDRNAWVKLAAAVDDEVQESLVKLPPDVDDTPAASHAFCVPLGSVYSLIVRPPTISAWHGTICINRFGGITMPTLYFHDEESTSTLLSRDARAAAMSSKADSGSKRQLPASWGGEAFLSQLRISCDVFTSQIECSLYLINPSREDREAHCTPEYDDDVILDPVPHHQRPKKHLEKTSILHQSLQPDRLDGFSPPSTTDLTFNILNSFSKITRNARSAAHTVLSHRLAKPIIPHLPEPIASFANANQPEFVRWSQQAGTEGYDAARVYLARWASVVAAEGERSRRTAFGIKPGEGEDTPLGAFELLEATYHIPQHKSHRAPSQPIQLTEWNAWFSEDGKLLLPEDEGRRRIFQRGIAESARKEIWPFVLRVFPWSSTLSERTLFRDTMREEFERLKDNWMNDETLKETDLFREESHRIEIDCRRTDRTQPLFAAFADDPDEEPSNMPPTNEHIISLGNILMTYNIWEKELGYVQGMSDLCGPLYLVLETDCAMTFWCFAKLMDRMKSHFLRDQSGMKAELSRLQHLLVLMDPQLHHHLETANSLNLFFCFRWILIAFKREFSYEDVLKVWEALWTDVCGPHGDLFLALAILEAHRDVIMRYLKEFDEVLRYVHDVAMTMNVDTLLSQTEILYLTFKSIAEQPDNGHIPEELKSMIE